MIKFAHMSDCHLGSWSQHPEMREMPLLAFERAIDTCVAEGVDFIIIAGDLFDTSLPGVDVLRHAAAKFRECKEAGINVYMVAGSHDYSPTGKTMLSVFESSGLISDVAKFEDGGEKLQLKFTTDEKTGAKITGVFGRKGSLEVEMFERLDRSIEGEPGFKIFVFHCGIDAQSVAGMSFVPVSLLPAGFDYYAAGHIHKRRVYDTGGKKIAFPGPLFPTSFDELEDYDSGFYIVTKDRSGLTVDRRKVKMFDIVLVEKDATGKAPAEVESGIISELEGRELENAAVLLKVGGTLGSGRPSDIDFKAIGEKAAALGALAVKRNISRLSSREMEEIRVESTANIDELEKKIVLEHADKIKLAGLDAQQLVLALMGSLKDEKGEDETIATFEGKIKENAKRLMGL